MHTVYILRTTLQYYNKNIILNFLKKKQMLGDDLTLPD